MKQRHMELLMLATGIAVGWMLASIVVPFIFGLI